MAKKVAAIEIYDDGSIHVTDQHGNPGKSMTEAEFETIVGRKKVKRVQALSMVTTNPCTYIWKDGAWVEVCW